jgi:hypothetical protein
MTSESEDLKTRRSASGAPSCPRLMRVPLGNRTELVMKTFIAISIFISFVILPSDGICQYIYFSSNGNCALDGTDCWDFIDTYYIFINTPDVDDAIGAYFLFDSEVYGPEDISTVNSHDNVQIQSGDLFSGLHLTWPSGQYSNDTLLTISVDMNEPHPVAPFIVGRTKFIELYRANGDTLALDSVSFICSHCYSSLIWVLWDHPDTTNAFIGGQTAIEIRGRGHSTGGLAHCGFFISDEQGWIAPGLSCGVFCYCPPCPWDDTRILLNVIIPDGVPYGTMNKIRIIPVGPSCMDDSSFFYVKADSTSPVAETSWGVIKSLYKKQ